MKALYVNPYTDFGFKKLFGQEASKDLLIDFLNELLPIKDKIVSLTFANNEKPGAIKAERGAIFDIHCTDEKGSCFIVEMQKAKLKFFKDRALYYSTFPIREMAETGDWNFELKPVYCVAILDFLFDEQREQKDVITTARLQDQYCHVFYEKLHFIFIEMPRFEKTADQLENHFEKWLYFLKNLELIETIPEILKEDVFIKGFEIARIANFTQDQLYEYERSLKTYRDLKGTMDTAREEGLEEGIQLGWEKGRQEGLAEGIKQGQIAIARQMKTNGLSPADIAKFTNLPQEEIDKL